MGKSSKSRSIIAVLSMVLPLTGWVLLIFFWLWIASQPQDQDGVGPCIGTEGGIALPITYWLAVSLWLVSLLFAITALCLRRLRRRYAANSIFLAILGLLAAQFMLIFANARCYSPTVGCLYNLKQLALANHVYAEDWDDHLPPARRWPVVVEETCGGDPDCAKCLICPQDKRAKRQAWEGVETSYTMNELCDGREKGAFDRPDETVLLFEGTALYGRGEVAAFRHPMARKDRLNVGYVDGHCKMLDKSSFEQLRWEP